MAKPAKAMAVQGTRPRRLLFSRSALHRIRDVPRDTLPHLVEAIAHALYDPLPDGTRKVKLREGERLFRIRVGDFRVIYTFDQRSLFVLAIDSRDRAYENLEELGVRGAVMTYVSLRLPIQDQTLEKLPLPNLGEAFEAPPYVVKRPVDLLRYHEGRIADFPLHVNRPSLLERLRHRLRRVTEYAVGAWGRYTRK